MYSTYIILYHSMCVIFLDKIMLMILTFYHTISSFNLISFIKRW